MRPRPYILRHMGYISTRMGHIRTHVGHIRTCHRRPELGKRERVERTCKERSQRLHRQGLASARRSVQEKQDAAALCVYHVPEAVARHPAAAVGVACGLTCALCALGHCEQNLFRLWLQHQLTPSVRTWPEVHQAVHKHVPPLLGGETEGNHRGPVLYSGGQ